MTLSPDYMIYLDWNLAPHSHSIDVPSKYRSSQNYTASLAHKVCYSALAFKVLIISLQANHSFQPNSCFTRFYHPVFGLTCLAVKTIKHVARDEEIFVNYKYSPAHAPSWFTDLLNK